MNKIEKLKKRLKELKVITSKGFATSEELQSYVNINRIYYEEAQKIQKEIEQLELELMTPEERKRYEKQMRFLALKAKGEPFDLDEFDDM